MSRTFLSAELLWKLPHMGSGIRIDPVLCGPAARKHDPTSVRTCCKTTA